MPWPWKWFVVCAWKYHVPENGIHSRTVGPDDGVNLILAILAFGIISTCISFHYSYYATRNPIMEAVIPTSSAS